MNEKSKGNKEDTIFWGQKEEGHQEPQKRW
jgi:hypothetical protein